MKLIPVTSSTIAAIGYDPATRVLRVAFKRGGSHDKADVSPEEYAAFMSAESHGSHFHQHFRGKTVRAPQQDEAPVASSGYRDGSMDGGPISTLDAAIERFTRSSE